MLKYNIFFDFYQLLFDFVDMQVIFFIFLCVTNPSNNPHCFFLKKAISLG